MFLVDDYESQVVEREEECGAGTDHYFEPRGAVVHGALPHLGTLLGVETRMVDTDGIAEETAQTVDNLCRKSNFGEEEEYLLAFV